MAFDDDYFKQFIEARQRRFMDRSMARMFGDIGDSKSSGKPSNSHPEPPSPFGGFDYRIVLDEPEATQKPHAPFPTPEEIVQRLSKWVVGQDEAKRVLACGAFYHYKRIAFNKQSSKGFSIGKSNICLVGPTGSGKTLLLETLASVLDVPFVTVDATELTPDGYVGTSVGDFVSKIQAKPGQKRQHAIVFIDEVDKLASGSRYGMEPMWVGGGGSSGSFRTTEIQQSLLKLLEGKEVGKERQSLFDSNEDKANTKDMLFVIGGAFSNMTRHPEYDGNVTPEDLIRYGLMPEFVGRFPVIAALDELSEDALVGILTGPEDCLVKQYKQLFEMVGAELAFTDGALRLIAQHAIQRGTGARGLRGVMEAVLGHFLYHAPSNACLRLEVCEDLVRARLETRN